MTEEALLLSVIVGADALCLATAANAIGGGAIIDADRADDVAGLADEMPDTFNVWLGGARLIGTSVCLLGVEHTMDLLEADVFAAVPDVDSVVAKPDADVFRSDLLARTAVGLTGCAQKNK